jgi:hypothetical protein
MAVVMAAFSVLATCINTKSDIQNNVAICTDCSSGIAVPGSCNFDIYNATVTINCSPNTTYSLVYYEDGTHYVYVAVNCRDLPMTGGTCSGGTCTGALKGTYTNVTKVQTQSEPCWTPG